MYNKRAEKVMRKTGLDTQLADLYKKSKLGWNENLQADFNRLHMETKEVRTTVETKLRNLFMGGVPWSPKLQNHRDTIELLADDCQKT